MKTKKEIKLKELHPQSKEWTDFLDYIDFAFHSETCTIEELWQGYMEELKQ